MGETRDHVLEHVDDDWRSPREIAENAGVHESTTRDALLSALRDRLVVRQRVGNAIFYRLRR